MSVHAYDRAVPAVQSIPLLDASFLPSTEDWVLLESIQMNMDGSDGFDHMSEGENDFRVAAAPDD